MRSNQIKSFAVTVALFAAALFGPSPASAVTVLFSGAPFSGNSGAGIIGHDAVAGSSIDPFYASVGIANVYTRLVSPDAYDFATGGELAIGANAPARSFAASAPASGALASIGINGPLHIGLRGFSLDVTPGTADITFAGFSENRVYRNGEVKIFEETAPNIFNEVASYTGGTFTIDIDYLTGSINNVFNGTLNPGSMTIFPETWTGTSFDPVDQAGTFPEIFGGFGVTSSLEIEERQVAVAEPAMPAMLGLGMLALAALRRARA
ncbi:MAG: hypothetical protein ACI9JL_004441 [Paracoccaceae bacterium]|jgi:hypothetical protein